MTQLNFIKLPMTQDIWASLAGHHSFTILLEESGRYTATSKDQLNMHIPCKVIKRNVLSAEFKTFDDAKAACERTASKLMQRG